jgi:hypothetical protein
MNTVLIEDEQLEINTNCSKDNKSLKMIKHYLNIKFLPTPFLWHYDDFSHPFPVYGVKKIEISKLRALIKDVNNMSLKVNLVGLDDHNTDIYTVAQYKNDSSHYMGVNDNELYLSYHTLLFNSLTRSFDIHASRTYFKFCFYTGMYSLDSNSLEAIDYHYHIPKKGNIIFQGVPVDSSKLEKRCATIHASGESNHIVFSGKNSCNFTCKKDNLAFISILKFPIVNNKSWKSRVLISNKKANVVVLHIFRNIMDNNPHNDNYQYLINKYMS